MDERLRALERLAEHDPDAAPRLLLERLRRGQLDEQRLGLLAHLGHEPARRAMGLGDDRAPSDLQAWLVSLARWGGATLVRAMAEAARVVVRRFEALAADDARPRTALQAAEAYCEAPSPERVAAARAAARAAQRAAQDVGRRADFRAEWSIDTPELYAAYHAAHLCAHVAHAVVIDASQAPVVEQAVGVFVRALERTGAPADLVLETARSGLLAWALGEGGR